MKVTTLTVRQPWATLLAHGIKHFETRSWRTRHEGLLAIHASLVFEARDRLWTLQTPEVRASLVKCGYHNVLELPVGGVLAVSSFFGCYRTQQLVETISPTERLLGDWSPGRWAWRLDQVRLLQTPVWTRGYQGLWQCEISDHLIEAQS